MVQMTRSGAESWDLTSCVKQGDVYAYEIIGRVVYDDYGDWYYVDVPQWQDIGYAWHRLEQRYATKRAAIRAVTERKKRAS